MTANVFNPVPVPVGDGSGAPVSVTGQGLKSFVIGGVFEATVIIEIGIGGKFAPLFILDKPNQFRDIPIVAEDVRVTIVNFRSGTPTVFVGGEPAVNQFSSLVVPANNGVGAALDTSLFGSDKTVIVSGVFDATLTVEIAEDVGGPWSPVGRIDKTSNFLTFNTITRFVRVLVTDFVSGAPTTSLGAADGVVTNNGLALGEIRDLGLTFNSISLVDVEEGSARDSTDSTDIVVGATLTANIAVNGVNGLDTGAEGVDTQYAVYVIADTTLVNPVASLLSINFVTPTLPAGYDVFRRVGAIFNLGNDIKTFIQYFSGVERIRRMQYSDALTGANALRILNLFSGSILDNLTSLVGLVPPGTGVAIIGTKFTIGVANLAFAFKDGSGDAIENLAPGIVVNDFQTLFDFIPITPATDIQWRLGSASNATISLYLRGYHDEL